MRGKSFPFNRIAAYKVIQEYGVEVTGLDPSEPMLAIAKKKIGETKSKESSIHFVQGDVLNGLPFADKSFDLAISSYVAHGLMKSERQILYSEMKRVARQKVVLLEYNENRSFITDIAELLEGGDYFRFIGNVRDELTGHFGNLKVIETGEHSAMYICQIKD